MPTVQLSLKRLAEIVDIIEEIQTSNLPPRVKKARERMLRKEAYEILAIKEPVSGGLCERCLETPALPEYNFCEACTRAYLDMFPRWSRLGRISEVECEVWVASLLQALLQNNLVGIPEDADGESEPEPIGD